MEFEMDTYDGFPFVDGDINFELIRPGTRLVFNRNDGKKFEFERHSGRWRHKGCGPFASCHLIASKLFRYRILGLK
jgi:hypothetical protein